jgi:peptide deformylase
VQAVDARLKALIAQMFDTMYDAKGIGPGPTSWTAPR